MSKKTIYFPHNMLLFAILLIVLLLVIGLLFVGVIGIAFAKVGFNTATIALILVGTFLGSYINIPLLKLKTTVPMIREEFVNFFGIPFRIPQVDYGETITVLAVNVGGALIPTAVSIYLLYKAAAQIIAYSLLGVLLVALITRAVARPVKGGGDSHTCSASADSGSFHSPYSFATLARDSCLRFRSSGHAHRRRLGKPECYS